MRRTRSHTVRSKRNPRDYYEILGVARTATPQEIKAAYHRCAKDFHPDRNKDPKAPARFMECDEAYKTLSDPERREAYDRHGSGAPGFVFGSRARHGGGTVHGRAPLRRPVAPKDVPAWQPDKRSLRNMINEAAGFVDKNFCLRAIHDESIKLGGELWLVTLYAFTGTRGRATLQVFCSEPALGFAGKVMEAYDSGVDPSVTSAQPQTPTKAVFAAVAGFPGRALLIRLLGDDVADVYDGLWLEYSTANPWGDAAFVRKATILVQLAEERLEQLQRSAADASSHARRPVRRPVSSGVEFFCPECSRRIVVAEGGVLPDACSFCELDLRPFRYWPTDLGELEPGFGRLRRRNSRGRMRGKRPGMPEDREWIMSVAELEADLLKQGAPRAEHWMWLIDQGLALAWQDLSGGRLQAAEEKVRDAAWIMKRASALGLAVPQATVNNYMNLTLALRGRKAAESRRSGGGFRRIELD